MHSSGERGRDSDCGWSSFAYHLSTHTQRGKTDGMPSIPVVQHLNPTYLATASSI